MSLENKLSQMMHEHFPDKENFNDEVVGKLHLAAMDIPDETEIGDLLFWRYYGGSIRLKKVFKPELHKWISTMVSLEKEQKKVIDRSIQTVRRRGEIMTVGELRDTTIEDVYHIDGIGRLTATVLKSIFNREPEDTN